MTSPKTRQTHELERTALLRYLVAAGFIVIPPALLLDYMDSVAFLPIDADALAFHAHYMAGKGWIELAEDRRVGEGAKLVWMRITPAGVDELDRRTGDLRHIVKKEAAGEA